MARSDIPAAKQTATREPGQARLGKTRGLLGGPRDDRVGTSPSSTAISDVRPATAAIERAAAAAAATNGSVKGASRRSGPAPSRRGARCAASAWLTPTSCDVCVSDPATDSSARAPPAASRQTATTRDTTPRIETYVASERRSRQRHTGTLRVQRSSRRGEPTERPVAPRKPFHHTSVPSRPGAQSVRDLVCRIELDRVIR